MTATEVLRRMLDERGVEWWPMHDAEAGYHDDRDTEFLVYGCKHVAHEWGCRLQVDMLTPEQAVSATLWNEESYTRDDVESAFVSGYSLGCLPVGSDPQWDQNEQTVDEHMAELGWVRAATLGSELPYDELLRCLENDWHISASWDGLRKFWCIELTEEGVKLRNSAHNTLTAEQVRDVIEVAKAELLESCKYLGGYEQRTNDVLKAFGKMEQAISATLGRPKVKAHPYGYEPDTGAFDVTRCECGCLNDISATYCNDCGGEIEIDMNAEKEIYHRSRHLVFVEKHDDGSLEFGGKRYIAKGGA